MPHVQRPGWIGGNKLHLYTFTGTNITTTKSVTCLKNLWYQGMIGI